MNRVSVHIACLFSGILVHGLIPEDFVQLTTIPIPKGNAVNVSYSGKYRGICLSSILGKIFDLSVLARCSDKLQSCEMQFGFKDHSSIWLRAPWY